MNKKTTRSIKPKISKLLKNKTILITGGAGSIGSALTIKLLKYPIRSLRIFDIDEHALFKLGRSITDKKLRLLLESILNQERLGMACDGVDIIFHVAAIKNIEISEYNPIVTNSHEMYEKIKLIRSHGRQDNISYFSNPESSDYVGIGYNWRMSTITAALGISQLSKLEKIIKMRQNNAKYLTSKLSKIDLIKTPKPPIGFEHIYQMYTVLLPTKEIRDNLQKFLLTKKIFSKVYFQPIHLTDFYSKKFAIKSGSLPVTERIADHVLTIPLYPNMTKEEMNYLTSSIFEFFELK